LVYIGAFLYLCLQAIVQTTYILLYMLVEFVKWFFFQIYRFWCFIEPVASPILYVVTLPIFCTVYILLYVINAVFVFSIFFVKYFVIDFYKYLDKNYQVTAHLISFTMRVYRVMRAVIFMPIYFVYMAFFHLNFLNFYVAYFWRPIRFVRNNLILGPILRFHEFFIDACDDIFMLFYSYLIMVVSRIRFIWHFYRRKLVLFLRPKNKGIIYMRYMWFRFLARCVIFFYAIWYFFSFLVTHSYSIGIWWGVWSIPSFLFFVTLYFYCFFYYCLRFFIVVKTYFDDYAFYFWCLACWSWICAQFAYPGTWGVPANKILKILIGFWF